MQKFGVWPPCKISPRGTVHILVCVNKMPESVKRRVQPALCEGLGLEGKTIAFEMEVFNYILYAKTINYVNMILKAKSLEGDCINSLFEQKRLFFSRSLYLNIQVYMRSSIFYHCPYFCSSPLSALIFPFLWCQKYLLNHKPKGFYRYIIRYEIYIKDKCV